MARFKETLRQSAYDIVLDLQGLLKSAWISRQASGVRHGYTWSCAREPLATLAYGVRHAVARNQHAIARNRQLAAAALGFQPDGPPRYGLVVAAARPVIADPYMVALHATSRADKLWPETDWRQFFTRLSGRAGRIVLPWGTPIERERSERLASGIDGAVVPARMAPGELAGLFAAARVVVGVDTGLLHLAVAAGAPALALFGPTDPALTGVQGERAPALNLGGNGVVPDVAQVLEAAGRAVGHRWRAASCSTGLAVIPRAPLWYELLWRLALPFALMRLWWRGRKEPGYRRHVGERLGRYQRLPDARPAIWIHAVSVGETRAAEPLVAALRESYPDHRLVLTHMTAAGRATGQALFGDRVTQAYFPYDTSFGASRFLEWCRPRFGLLMETELWPNMILRAAARGIPLFLVNARMSEASARGYGRLARMSRNMLQALAGVAAQAAADAERLTRLGARRVAVTGNVKFDVAVPDTTAERGRALRRLFGESRPVWVAGSTRDGEEALLLAALVRAPLPANALLVIVPRSAPEPRRRT